MADLLVVWIMMVRSMDGQGQQGKRTGMLDDIVIPLAALLVIDTHGSARENVTLNVLVAISFTHMTRAQPLAET